VAVDVRHDGLVLAAMEGESDPPRLSVLSKIPWQGNARVPAADLAQYLAPLIEQNDLQGCQGTTLLHRPQFNLVLTDAPDGVSGEDLRAAMRWRVKDLLDFPVEEAVLDVLPLPDVDLPGEGAPVFVVAAPQETVRERIQACRQADLELGIVDIPDQAHRNLARLLPEPASGTCLVVLDAETPLISITKGGELIFSRQLGLDIPGEFAALARELGVGEGEARRLRTTYGLAEEPAAAGAQVSGTEALELEEEPDSYGSVGPLHRFLADFADRLALEVQRSLDYYHSHYRQGAVRKVHLAGEGARVEGLAPYLESVLDLQFVFFDPLDHLPARTDLQEGQEATESLVQEGIYAIGAGLRIRDPESG